MVFLRQLNKFTIKGSLSNLNCIFMDIISVPIILIFYFLHGDAGDEINKLLFKLCL